MIPGFLAGFVLLGIASVAWPLYLHLLQRRQRSVQVVPSLLLFATEPSARRRRRLRERVLLASRAGALLALFILVAQPFLETHLRLPLPLQEASVSRDHAFALLVDDSLEAFAGRRGDERLLRTKEWLVRILDELPISSRVAVATTSHASCTGFLAKSDALKLIDALGVVPVEGDALRSLASLSERAATTEGTTLLIAAPRSKSLWPFDGNSDSGRLVLDEMVRGSGPRGAERVLFLDTTDVATAPYISDITSDGVAPARGETRQGDQAADGRHRRVVWLCGLRGDEESLSDATLQVLNQKGDTVLRRPLGVQEVLQRRARVVAGEFAEGAYEVRIDPASRSGNVGSAPSDRARPLHPWQRYFTIHRPQATVSERSVVLRGPAAAARRLAAVVAESVDAMEPTAEIVVVDVERASAETLPRAGRIILCASPEECGDVLPWFEAQLAAGARALCLAPASTPHANGASASSPSSGLLLPSWSDAQRAQEGELSTLQLHRRAVPAGYEFDELLLGNLGDVAFDAFYSPTFPGGPAALRRDTVVLSTSMGRPLLARLAADRGSVWALGLAVDMKRGGVAYHPIFPLLLRWILFPQSASTDARKPAGVVGSRIVVEDWPGIATGALRVTTPSGGAPELAKGSAETVPDAQPTSLSVALREAGIYRVQASGAVHPLASNWPRPSVAGDWSTREWETSMGVDEVLWLPARSDAQPREARGVSPTTEGGRQTSGNTDSTNMAQWLADVVARPSAADSVDSSHEAQRYDLSVLAALALVVCLALEAVALIHAGFHLPRPRRQGAMR